jgi:predicted nucleic acid-binding protein
VGKRYLIDSNIVIDYLNNELPGNGMVLMNDVVDDFPNISIITQIEVLRFNTTDTSYQILRNFIQDSIIFNLNDLVVDKTIAICKSHKVKLPDAIIAATAITSDLILITRNTDDFKKIAGLKLLNPWKISANQDPLQSL